MSTICDLSPCRVDNIVSIRYYLVIRFVLLDSFRQSTHFATVRVLMFKAKVPTTQFCILRPTCICYITLMFGTLHFSTLQNSLHSLDIACIFADILRSRKIPFRYVGL